MQLPGRVEEPGTVSGRGGDPAAVPDRGADGGERRLRGDGARGVGHDGEVSAGLGAFEERLDAGLGARRRHRLGLRQPALALEGRQHLLGVVLRLLHVGLVKGVDAQNRPGDRRGDLPPQEFAAEVELVPERQRDHRLAGLLQRLHCAIRRLAIHADVDEQPVLSVCPGLAQGLALHGHDALALLARALGDQLLHPVAEGGDLRRGDQRDLVPAPKRQLAHHRAQPGARVFVDRNRVGA